MKMIKSLTIVIMIVVCLVGCSKKSALEGKVVDGKGQPATGIKLIATQIEPIKGYEKFETTTGADGGFRFGKLFPASEYELVPYIDKYIAEAIRIKMKSGPEGQTKLLPAALELRFATPKEGVVIDTKTGLMWARNANIGERAMNWNEAMNWAQRLNYAGYNSGWRLPTKEEFEAFIHAIRLSNVQAGRYWSSTTYAGITSIAWCVVLPGGSVGFIGKSESSYVWPVRSGQ